MISNFKTRSLTENDFDMYYQSWLNRKELFDGKIHSEPVKESPQFQAQILKTLNSSDILVIGNFINEELIASVCAHSWKSLPHYTFFDFFTTKNCSYKFYDNAESLFRYSFNHFEKSKRYTFYMMTKLRAFQKTELIKNNQMTKIVKNLPSFMRYDIYVEELISAGEQSDYKIHNELLRNQHWNCPTLIRKGCLKQEFRTLDIKSQILEKNFKQDVQL